MATQKYLDAASSVAAVIVKYAILVALLVFIIAPLAFMVTASFMPARDIITMPYPWVPKSFYTQNFLKAIAGNTRTYLFFRSFLNSMIVASIVTVSTIIIASLTGYSLSKFSFPGRDLVLMLIMATMMIPFETIMIPLQIVTSQLKLQNSYTGMILPFLVDAFAIFLMRQYFITFPDEFIDAARVDGMGEFSIYRKILLPNAGPAIATLSILTFRNQWDSLMWPLLVVQSEKMKTLPLYIVKFTGDINSDEGSQMAVALLASIPMLILFFSMSKYFISGSILHSSRKG
ncbi:MAG: ABC transporter permease [Spirochaetes bacterium RBG_13_68_11]|nr:MAG: ABC transporter permease [Spirochaetes bacterium RBG_13_68_11]